MITAAPRLQVSVAGGPLPRSAAVTGSPIGTQFCRPIEGPPGSHVVYELVEGEDGTVRLELIRSHQ